MLCAYCERPVEMNEWHPVATERDGDSTLQLYHFCDQSCREEWAGD